MHSGCTQRQIKTLKRTSTNDVSHSEYPFFSTLISQFSHSWLIQSLKNWLVRVHFLRAQERKGSHNQTRNRCIECQDKSPVSICVQSKGELGLAMAQLTRQRCKRCRDMSPTSNCLQSTGKLRLAMAQPTRQRCQAGLDKSPVSICIQSEGKLRLAMAHPPRQ